MSSLTDFVDAAVQHLQQGRCSGLAETSPITGKERPPKTCSICKRLFGDEQFLEHFVINIAPALLTGDEDQPYAFGEPTTYMLTEVIQWAIQAVADIQEGRINEAVKNLQQQVVVRLRGERDYLRQMERWVDGEETKEALLRRAEVAELKLALGDDAVEDE